MSISEDIETIGWDDYDYFIKRLEGKIYVSKAINATPAFGPVIRNRRIIRKVIDKPHAQFERLDVTGHIVLRESEQGRDQIKVVIYGNEPDKQQITLQRFRRDTGTPFKSDAFTFRQNEFEDLLDFLTKIKLIDYSNKEKFTINQSDIGTKKVLVDLADKEIISTFKSYTGEKREQFFNLLKDQNITKEDLDILSGRKSGLEEFQRALEKGINWAESQWQIFFERNTWIFGYGLDYKFLRILQREGTVSNIDLDGKNAVKTDFLMADKNFTVIVELKKPITNLFDKDQDRSESWRLSKDITYSISQILAQKAEWQIKSESENFDSNGNLIFQKTFDPKTILIIGHSNQFSGEDRISKIKAKTFELFRRNMRNIEIFTYDELLERAEFIVKHNDNISSDSDNDYEDLPF